MGGVGGRQGWGTHLHLASIKAVQVHGHEQVPRIPNHCELQVAVPHFEADYPAHDIRQSVLHHAVVGVPKGGVPLLKAAELRSHLGVMGDISRRKHVLFAAPRRQRCVNAGAGNLPGADEYELVPVRNDRHHRPGVGGDSAGMQRDQTFFSAAAKAGAPGRKIDRPRQRPHSAAPAPPSRKSPSFRWAADAAPAAISALFKEIRIICSCSVKRLLGLGYGRERCRKRTCGFDWTRNHGAADYSGSTAGAGESAQRPSQHRQVQWAPGRPAAGAQLDGRAA